MKRFITYLYEYHLGEKKRNVGFVRVDIRNSMVNMEVCIRNYMQTNEKGNVYGLIQKDRLYSVMLGEIMSHGRQSDNRICFEKDNIGNSGCSIEEIAGIVICFENNGYLASCWRDDSAEEIAREIFSPYKADVMIAERECLQEENVTPVKEKEDSVVEGIQKVEEKHLEQKNSEEKEDYITYQKIELNQIRELPSQNWHLCNNSFLMHGAFNYGYLLLKKVIEDEKEIWMLRNCCQTNQNRNCKE